MKTHHWFLVFIFLFSSSIFAAKIRVNEIYYDPPGSSSEEVENEFVELYVTEGGFDPSGWYILDWDNDHNKWAIPDSCPQVETGAYIVFHMGKGTDYVSGNSYYFYMGETSAKLSNTGDPIGLRDDKDVPQDFVAYESGTDDDLTSADFCSWPNDGKNLTDKGLTVPSDTDLSLQLCGDDLNNSSNWIWAEPACGGKNKEVYFPVLLINEIKFKGSSKWIEVYCQDDGNNGKGVDLNGYYFSDLDGETDKTLETCFIYHDKYILLRYNSSNRDDTSLISENGSQFVNVYSTTDAPASTSDQMVLFDTFGRIKDAVAWCSGDLSKYEEEDNQYLYENDAWSGASSIYCINTGSLGDGSSLSRKFSLSDTNSKDDWEINLIPTPGFANDRKEIFSGAPQISNASFTPQPFILSNSGLLKIDFELSYDANLALRIYDVKGRLCRSLEDNGYYLAGQNSIMWDGKNEEGRNVKMGIYILYMEAKGSQGISTLKKTVVVGKRK